MSRLQRGALLGLPLLLLLGCGGNTDVKSVPPPNAGDTGAVTTPDNTPTWDPANGIVPLPNVLATAASPAFNLATEAPTSTTPLNPLNALRYVNTIEVAGKHAVAGINAPIFMEFTRPIDPATLAAGFKIYEITPDAAGTEDAQLGFTDISALFTFQVLGADATTEGTNQVLAFPKLPLKPATRYVYVVTGALKDATTHLGVGQPLAFGFASQATPLIDPTNVVVVGPPPVYKSLQPLLTNAQATALEGIRGNVTAGGHIALSGYAKTVGDLVASGKVAFRGDVKVLGRFITTGAVGTYTDPANPATLKPIDALLKAFATAGAPGNPFTAAAKNWSNAVTVSAVVPAATFFTGSFAALPHSHVKNVVLGSFTSADLAVDPFRALALNDLAGTDASTMNATGTNSTYNVAFTGATGPVAYGMLVQKRSSAGTGSLLQGFYNVPRTVNFIYFEPLTPAGATVPTVIYSHGITSQKETGAALADTACGLGQGVVAIDLPMHGTLARPNLTGNSSDLLAPGVTKGAVWGQDFMSLSSPLTGRTNIQQAAFNLFRLEYLMRTGAMAAALGTAGTPTVGPTPGATGNITYVGVSLGSIVGTYFLAGTTNINPGTGVYDAASIASSPRALLSVPGGQIAYLLKGSASFGAPVKAGVSAGINALLTGAGLTPGTPAYIAAFNRNYQSTFHLLQCVVDPVDPATMGHPALTGIAGAGAISRLTGRVAIQEALNDQVIPNTATRYFATSFAGWNVASPVDFAPGFKQIQYSATSATPHTGTNGVVVPFMTKFSAPAAAPTSSTPTEGYFQFDQAGISHAFLIDWATSAADTALGQKQMAYFLGAGGSSIVVDPTTPGF